MNSSITIEVPEGKVAKQVTNPDGSISIIFVDKEPIKSKSWDEFCKNHPDTQEEWYLTPTNDCIDQYVINSNCRDIHILLETKEDSEAILALIKLTRLHDEWVGDWKGDYIEPSMKYQIIYSGNEPCVGYHCSEHSLLDFPNKKMAIEFLECFEDLILKAKRFI